MYSASSEKRLPIALKASPGFWSSVGSSAPRRPPLAEVYDVVAPALAVVPGAVGSCARDSMARFWILNFGFWNEAAPRSAPAAETVSASRARAPSRQIQNPKSALQNQPYERFQIMPSSMPTPAAISSD